jgi:anti-anti-sigma regulatory factor
VLDVDAAVELCDHLLDGTADTDVVVDLRDVAVCGPAAAECLCTAARRLRAVNATLTLSHLSPPAESALADEVGLPVRHVPRPRR